MERRSNRTDRRERAGQVRAEKEERVVYTASYKVNRSDGLLEFLLRKCNTSRNNVKNLLVRKQVLVNGSVVTQYDFPLAKDDEVKLAKSPVRESEQVKRTVVKKAVRPQMKIIYEDDDLIAVDKPCGLLSVENEKEVQSLFAQIGDVDILVNNAGVSLIKQIQDTSLDEYEKVFAVNMRGAFLCTREACKAMLSKKSGLIVNISSVWGEVGGSCESVYSASKGGLIAFTKALASELAYSGIRVNAVSPGVIDTPMNAHFSLEEKALIQADIPLGRMGNGEDIAKAVLFLEDNDYITGIDLPVNGGFSIV